MVTNKIPRAAIAAAAAALLAASVIGLMGGRSRPSGAGGEGEAARASSDAGVVIIDFSFDPDLIEAEAGEVITWTNEDSATHTVTSDDDGPLASGDLPQGETYEATFGEPGTYKYICTIHPTMKGTVEVAA